MDTSTTTTTIETIILTINNKILESSKVNSDENKIRKFVTGRIVHRIIMIKDQNKLR